MTTKRTRETKPVAPNVETAEERRRAAKTMIDGTVCGAVTARYLPGVGGVAVDAIDVRDCIDDLARGVAEGDLSVLERMLLQQAAGLQAMFAELAFKAKAQTNRDNLQSLTALALKAAAGSRQAITALAELRMPRQVLFAKQANVNNGGQQQVNNCGVRAGQPAPAGVPRTGRNELLEAQDGQRLDAGATGTSGGVDPRLETVGACHRPAKS